MRNALSGLVGALLKPVFLVPSALLGLYTGALVGLASLTPAWNLDLLKDERGEGRAQRLMRGVPEPDLRLAGNLGDGQPAPVELTQTHIDMELERRSRELKLHADEPTLRHVTGHLPRLQKRTPVLLAQWGSQMVDL
jgi:hypothetical protein